MADDQADPDFLALSQRARDCIDRAYDRAVRRATGGSRKRRKLNPGRHDKGSGGQEYAGGAGSFLPEGDEGGGGFIAEDDDAGGFIPDEGEGGFVPDDDGAGGFLPDDGDAGGFIADDTSDPKVISTSASTPTGSRHAPKVPLTRIPALLSQLNLPADDDVLNVFRASATGWADEEGDEAGSSRRRRPNEPEEEDRDSKLGVERKDFRAVCAALLGGDEGDLPLSEDEGEDVDMEQEASNADVLGPGRRRQRPSALAPPSGSDDEDDEDGDGFEPTMSEGSSLSSLSSDSEYGASRKRSKATSTTTPKGKSKGKGKARAAGTETDASAVTTPRRKGKSKKDALVADDGPIKLNTRQKEMVRTLWEMLKPPQAEQQQGASRGRRGGGGSNPNVLGRDEVKAWVRQLGEMWTDDEITDMVSLFSTQHEKRGLSFEDFGQVMVRGRIV